MNQIKLEIVNMDKYLYLNHHYVVTHKRQHFSRSFFIELFSQNFLKQEHDK